MEKKYNCTLWKEAYIQNIAGSEKKLVRYLVPHCDVRKSPLHATSTQGTIKHTLCITWCLLKVNNISDFRRNTCRATEGVILDICSLDLLSKLQQYLSLLTAFCLPNGQFWAIIDGDSLTHAMLITAFYIFDPKATGSLLVRLDP